MAARDKDELTVDDKFELLIAALTARQDGGISKADLAEILEANAKGVRKAMKPENSQHPGVSVFSHPEGDLAQPKPPLPFTCFYNGYPIHKFPETETWSEWELFAQVKPGDFMVIRKDGTPMSVSVTGDKDAHGKLTKVDIVFPVLRGESSLVPSKRVVLYQLIHNDNPRKAFVEAMQADLADLFREPVTA